MHLDTATEVAEEGRKAVGQLVEEGFGLAQTQKLRAGGALKMTSIKGSPSRVHVRARGN